MRTKTSAFYSYSVSDSKYSTVVVFKMVVDNVPRPSIRQDVRASTGLDAKPQRQGNMSPCPVHLSVDHCESQTL